MQALDDVKVLDLSRFMAGPGAVQLLADFGAEVVKVERPERGDDQRWNGIVFLDGGKSRESSYYLAVNRNKRSVTVDLSKPAGQDLVRRLATKSDVVVENYRVGTLARYGLDYATLKALNPRLIYCSVTGYGQEGPYADRAGYDPIFQAQSGMMSVTGIPDGAPGAGPMKMGVNIVDWSAGVNAAFGIMVALHERARSGEGQYLDVALLDCAMAGMAGSLMPYFMSGYVQGRAGNYVLSGGPTGTFPCADGHIMLSVGTDEQFRKLCEVLGDAAMADDPRFTTLALRGQNHAALYPKMEVLSRRHSSRALVRALAEAGVPAGEVNNVAEALEDPQVKARGIAAPLPHPLQADLRTVANPARLSRTPPEYRRAPPMLGQHTDEVLKEWLGLEGEALLALRREQVI